ncbi:16948_t:CDS:2, partial [Acaulospora colombiana]
QTGECAWEKPANIKLHQRDPTGEWWEFYDEEHQHPYYYHPTSGQTEWTVPKTGTIISLKKIQNSSIGKRMSVALIPSDGMDINQMQLLHTSAEAKYASTMNPDRSPGMLSSMSAFTRSIENLTITGSPPSLNSSCPKQGMNGVQRTRDMDSSNMKSEQSKDSLASKTEIDYSYQKNSVVQEATKPLSHKSSENSSDEYSSSNPSEGTTLSITNTAISEKTIASLNGGASLSKSGSKASRSRPSIKSSNSAASVTASGQKTPVNGNDQVTPTRKYSKSVNPNRVSGISSPSINFEEDTTKFTNKYTDLGRKRSGYQLHTRKLSTGEVKIMPQELQQDIVQFSIDGFARKYF